MHPVWDATLKGSIVVVSSVFQFMHPVWDATAKFKHYLVIHHFFMQSYLIVTSIPYFSLVKIIKAICYKIESKDVNDQSW